MSIANDLIALVERAAAGRPPARLRALHLPPVSAAGSKNGEFCALELDSGALGLSYVMLDDTLARLAADHQQLAGLDALSVARWYGSESGVRRTLGFAAINALSREFFDAVAYAPPAASDSTGMIEACAGDHIGMIGLFTPLVGRIVAAGARLTVAELKAEFAGDADGYRVTLDAGELAACNKILSTSTLLLNDSLDRMLAICRSAHSFAMIGPGAGCLPDPLFARGVTLLGGSWITDNAACIDALRRGESWGRQTRKFAIRRDDYPGFAALAQARPL